MSRHATAFEFMRMLQVQARTKVTIASMPVVISLQARRKHEPQHHSRLGPHLTAAVAPQVGRRSERGGSRW